MQAATQIDTGRMKKYKDDAEGLKGFILDAGVDGMNEKELLAIVFQKQTWRDDDEMRDAFDEKLKDL